MRTWSIKTESCAVCGDDFTWTTKKAEFCVPCRKVKKDAWQREKRGSVKRILTNRGAEDDKLPKIDWVMELQFPTFFNLLGKRYKDIKDVGSVIQSKDYIPKGKVI